MKIFIDESGDPGFKIEEGSSRFFVVALIIFEEEAEENRARTALDNLKKEWQEKDTFEFKFSKMSIKERKEVLEVAMQAKFKIRAVVFDKVRMNTLQLEHFKENYYQYAIRSLLEHQDCHIQNSEIRIDTFGETYYRNNLIKYFNKHLCSSEDETHKHLIFQDSKFNVLIQLADLVAGSLRKSFDKSTDDSQIYRDIFSKYEEDIKVFHSVLHTH
ncbi:MAG: DUF3800 domain-containing protein [Candidatus Pacebacteria bacterium]|nr:DUF3800 domain-containing protein [Candidatus Paceibacterota bacterium]